MRKDLERARETWLKEAEENPDELERRTQSDFLCYCDEDGLYADFHSNRHTFISNLGRANVSLAKMQKLVRHSDPRLTVRYTHSDRDEDAAAVATLPAPPTVGGEGDGGLVTQTSDFCGQSVAQVDAGQSKGKRTTNKEIDKTFLIASPMRKVCWTKCCVAGV